jgi:hypothetical protein
MLQKCFCLPRHVCLQAHDYNTDKRHFKLRITGEFHSTPSAPKFWSVSDNSNRHLAREPRAPLAKPSSHHRAVGFEQHFYRTWSTRPTSSALFS